MTKLDTESDGPVAWIVHATNPYVVMYPPAEGGLPRTPLYKRPKDAERKEVLAIPYAVVERAILYNDRDQFIDWLEAWRKAALAPQS